MDCPGGLSSGICALSARGRQFLPGGGEDGVEMRYTPSCSHCCDLDARKHTMSNGSSLSLDELENRLAIVRENIRQLMEQATGYSGAEDEERNADRLAKQSEALEQLLKQRETLLKK